MISDKSRDGGSKLKTLLVWRRVDEELCHCCRTGVSRLWVKAGVQHITGAGVYIIRNIIITAAASFVV
jgi:hypothetical protein